MIITTFSDKGGVGKTVITSNLGAELAKRGRTLLVDFDTNGDCGIAFGIPPTPIVYQYFSDMPDNRLMTTTQAVINIMPNLDILRGNASTAYLTTIAITNPMLSQRVMTNRFRELVRGYDYVVVDTAVGSGIMRTIAVEQADQVIVPVNMAAVDIHKITSTLEHISAPTWLLPSRVDRRNSVDRDLADTLAEYWPNHLAPVEIPLRQVVAKAGVRNQPVVIYKPNTDIAAAFEKLATFIIEKGTK